MIIDGSHDGMTMRAARTHGCLKLEAQAFHIDLGDLAQFVAALYEAAGKPAPVILAERKPALYDHLYFGSDFRIERGGAEIRATLGARTTVLDASAARSLAAYLAAAADSAEAAAKDAEVTELTGVLRDVTPGMALPGSDYKTAVARNYAEAALRWMREREATP